MTTPTPAAAPAAPAAAAPATDPATAAPAPAPAASAPSPAPAAPAPAPAAAPPPLTSLLPPADPAAAAPAPAPAPAAPAAAPVVHPEWFWADGVKGVGAPPAWFKADKYKTVDKQAEAYPQLEKRMGAFVGAPEGDYEIKLPETVTGELDKEHPILQGFTAWAKENQLSQQGFNDILGMFAEYEAAQAPDMVQIKTQLGENADERIVAVSKFVQANLGSKDYETFRVATSERNAAAVFEMAEKLMKLARQPALPGVGREGAGQGQAVSPKAVIDAERAKKGPDGKLLYFTNQEHRAKVDKMMTDYIAAEEARAAGGQ